MWYGTFLVKGLDTYQRYLLIQLHLNFSFGQVHKCTYKEISKMFGLPVGKVHEAFSLLHDKNLVSLGTISSGGKGRPSTTFKLNSLTLQPDQNILRAHHAVDAVTELLKDATLKTSMRKHPLTVSNRMLLITLIAFMDETWTVRHKGHRVLAEFSGLKKSTMRHRLECLEQLGYIRDHITGLTDTVFFGKAESVYFLSPTCVKWQKDYFRGGALIFASGSDSKPLLFTNGNGSRESDLIILKARSIKKEANKKFNKNNINFIEESLRKELDIWNPIYLRSYTQNHESYFLLPESGFDKYYHLFLQHHDLISFSKYLQYIFEYYASYLLTECWEFYSADNETEIASEIIGKIRDELHLDRLKGSTDDIVEEDVSSASRRNYAAPIPYLIANMIFQFSNGIARAFVLLLKQLKDVKIDYGAMRFRILPNRSASDRICFAVELFPNHAGIEPAEYIRVWCTRNNLRQYNSSSEKLSGYGDITSIERVRCGLEQQHQSQE